MDKLLVLFVIALFTNGAFGQQDQNNNDEDKLEDRYGFNNPSVFTNQMRFPSQNQFPGNNRFPGQNQFPGNNRLPGQNQFPGNNRLPGQQTTTTQAPSSTITTQSPAVRACLATCPSTPEYNPVCGTNDVTYDNPGRLACAQACGVTVSLRRTSRCPAPPAP